jgi:hypothetical protein
MELFLRESHTGRGCFRTTVLSLLALTMSSACIRLSRTRAWKPVVVALTAQLPPLTGIRPRLRLLARHGRGPARSRLPLCVAG